jgi:hypothetical protein
VIPAKGMKGLDPLGQPFKIRPAEKVYLLVHSKKSEDKAPAYADEIVKRLRKAGIKAEKVPCDWKDIDAITKTTRKLILRERGKDSEIAINLGSGSKNHAIGMDRACMTFRYRRDITQFYTEPKKWAVHKNAKKLEQLTTGVKLIKKIHTHRIIVPEPILIYALQTIYKNAESIPLTYPQRQGVTKKKLAKALFGNDSRAFLTKLQRNVTQKLVDPWKAVEFYKPGRSEYVALTHEGDYLRYILENPETSGQ